MNPIVKWFYEKERKSYEKEIAKHGLAIQDETKVHKHIRGLAIKEIEMYVVIAIIIVYLIFGG